MKEDKEYFSLLITRTMFCEECKKKAQPKAKQKFIVYGGTSKKYKVLTVESNVQTKFEGYTPHLIQASGLNKKGDGVVVIINCAVDGCGLTLTYNEDKGVYQIDFKEVKVRVLPINEWDALYNRWHGYTGYTI